MAGRIDAGGFHSIRRFEPLEVNRRVTIDEVAPVRSLTPPANMIDINQQVSGEVLFFATGADNDTIEFTLWLIRLLGNPSNAQQAPQVIYDPVSLGTGTATLSTIVGIADGVVLNTERFADGIAFTPTAYATYLSSLTGTATPVVFNPADNVNIGMLGIRDFGGLGRGVVIQLTQGSVGPLTDMGIALGKWT